MFLILAHEIMKDLSGPKPLPSEPPRPWPDYGHWREAVNTVFRFRPVDLQQYMEQFWAASPQDYYWGVPNMRQSMAEPVRIGKRALSDEPGSDSYRRPPVPGVDPKVSKLQPRLPENRKEVIWNHLIYSYMIENTRIVEIFRRVLHEIFNGEGLGRPTELVMNWAHLTERLVFSPRDTHYLNPPISEIRPDSSAIRRNAYYRLFGMDLSHGLGDSRPYPYVKPEAANRDFVPTWEALMREGWRAYTNRSNKSGVNSTDDARMADLCKRLQNMLRVRRHAGSMSQHEFYCDAIMSWFHLTVSADNEVVYWLQAQAHDEATRLRAIGERAGLPAHTHSYEYFEVAEFLQEIISRIERGDFNDADSVRELYEGEKDTTSKLTTIINHWSTATGRNLKEYVGADSSRPLALPAPRMATVQITRSRLTTGR